MVGEKIRLVVFDLDGTIADSKKVYVETIQRTLAKNGFHFSKKQIDDSMGPKLEGTLLNLKEFDKKLLGKLKSEINGVIESLAHSLKVAPYSAQVLRKLSESGKYTLILMTNSTHRFAHNFLHYSGLEIYFDQILGAEDFAKKESAFRSLFRELRVKPSEAIYIGDKKSDENQVRSCTCQGNCLG